VLIGVSAVSFGVCVILFKSLCSCRGIAVWAYAGRKKFSVVGWPHYSLVAKGRPLAVVSARRAINSSIAACFDQERASSLMLLISLCGLTRSVSLNI